LTLVVVFFGMVISVCS